MKQFITFFCVAFFSLFVGSQITEGVLLVPYWQSLSATEFYSYYAEFGPIIGRFYTILTIMAALIPIGFTVYCYLKKSKAINFALVSSFFTILFLSAFYVYFKGTNELFYQAVLSEQELERELVTWNTWHWGRIILELAALLFLVLAATRIQSIKSK